MQPTRETIIATLYSSEDFNAAIAKMKPCELQEELKQEVFVVICNLPENKLLDINSRGELVYYAVRTMLNMICSDRSEFYNTFRQANYSHVTELSPAERFTTAYDESPRGLPGEADKFYRMAAQDETATRQHHLQLDRIAAALQEMENSGDSGSHYEAVLVRRFAAGRLRFQDVANETGLPYHSTRRGILNGLQSLKEKVEQKKPPEEQYPFEDEPDCWNWAATREP